MLRSRALCEMRSPTLKQPHSSSSRKLTSCRNEQQKSLQVKSHTTSRWEKEETKQQCSIPTDNEGTPGRCVLKTIKRQLPCQNTLRGIKNRMPTTKVQRGAEPGISELRGRLQERIWKSGKYRFRNDYTRRNNKAYKHNMWCLKREKEEFLNIKNEKKKNR